MHPEELKTRLRNIKDLVLIGVMDPERNEKQRAVVDLEVSERENVTVDNYQNVVRRVWRESGIVLPDYKLLLLHDVLGRGWLHARMYGFGNSKERPWRAGRKDGKDKSLRQKPSALSFAQYSGVEITQKVTDFWVSSSCMLTYTSMLIRATIV